MTQPKQLWILAVGNGAGKSTFYDLYLAPYGIKFINADLIAKDIDSENPERSSYRAATLAARVHQRVSEGGHNVPSEKIHSRIPRTMKHIETAISLVNETRLLDNSLQDDPFRQVAVLKSGKCEKLISPFPEWAKNILSENYRC